MRIMGIMYKTCGCIKMRISGRDVHENVQMRKNISNYNFLTILYILWWNMGMLLWDTSFCNLEFIFINAKVLWCSSQLRSQERRAQCPFTLFFPMNRENPSTKWDEQASVETRKCPMASFFYYSRPTEKMTSCAWIPFSQQSAHSRHTRRQEASGQQTADKTKN